MPDPAAETLAHGLKRLIAGAGPVLVVGDPLPAGSCDEAHITRRDGEALLAAPPGDGERFAVAVVLGALEHMPRPRAELLLGRLRDLHARRVLVAVPADPGNAGSDGHWTLEQMLAHGFEGLGECSHEGRRLALYRFDIHHYKRTPDWLNARNWANPELWGRYRW